MAICLVRVTSTCTKQTLIALGSQAGREVVVGCLGVARAARRVSLIGKDGAVVGRAVGMKGVTGAASPDGDLPVVSDACFVVVDTRIKGLVVNAAGVVDGVGEGWGSPWQEGSEWLAESTSSGVVRPTC